MIETRGNHRGARALPSNGQLRDRARPGGLELGSDDMQALYRGGFLHDIGMLAIPDEVLRKPRPARTGRIRAD